MFAAGGIMKASVYYDSATGNTAKIAKAIQSALPEGTLCEQINADTVPESELVFAGFWTDKGSCTEQFADFLKKLDKKKVALFGTCGMGGSPGYFTQIAGRVRENLPKGCTVAGEFMCQGAMQASVGKRYEAMLEKDPENVQYQKMLENFKTALVHPDDLDEIAARRFAGNVMKSV
jgi:flavodoxin I